MACRTGISAERTSSRQISEARPEGLGANVSDSKHTGCDGRDNKDIDLSDDTGSDYEERGTGKTIVQDTDSDWESDDRPGAPEWDLSREGDSGYDSYEIEGSESDGYDSYYDRRYRPRQRHVIQRKVIMQSYFDLNAESSRL